MTDERREGPRPTETCDGCKHDGPFARCTHPDAPTEIVYLEPTGRPANIKGYRGGGTRTPSWCPCRAENPDAGEALSIVLATARNLIKAIEGHDDGEENWEAIASVSDDLDDALHRYGDSPPQPNAGETLAQAIEDARRRWHADEIDTGHYAAEISDALAAFRTSQKGQATCWKN
jgi:hypothetical protein